MDAVKSNIIFIPCAVGEVYDKYSILCIKMEKAIDIKQKNNIEYELNKIKQYVDINDSLYIELFNINKQLWRFEDLIRTKSNKQEFDKIFIECAKKIHETNDKRYIVKRNINEKYNSDIIEEKIYNIPPTESKEIVVEELKEIIIEDNSQEITVVEESKEIIIKNEPIEVECTKTIITFIKNMDVNQKDAELFAKGQYLFKENKVIESYEILLYLANKYDRIDGIDYFKINIIYSLYICESFMGLIPKYENVLTTIGFNSEQIEDEDLKTNIMTVFCLYLLLNKKYKSAYPYLKYMNKVDGPNNINLNTISYLKKTDVGKTMLIYSSGGLGDIIMFSRFFEEFCNKNIHNKILYCVHDKLYWLFREVFRHIPNLLVFPYCNSIKAIEENPFDAHTSIVEIFKLLNKKYNSITNNYYLSSIKGSDIDLTKIISKTKKNVVINWHGNKENVNESSNRKINLGFLKIIFENSNINFISVQKDVSKEDEKLLKKYGVKNLAKSIDNNDKAFYDTITIFKNVDLVISTDTSLLHLSGSMGVPTIAMLTIGCDWRWTRNESSNWYPNTILMRQDKYNEWGNVIRSLNSYLSTF